MHGGANEQVMIMLKKIGTMDKAQQFVKDALAAKEKVMGIGHRVYKDGDPRAAILRKTSQMLTKKIGEPLWYDMSVLIDDTMNKEKGLMPNVDFYSGIVMRAMGIPNSMFTAVFALARTAGWVAQWNEMVGQPGNKIGRPRQVYTGKPRRDVPKNN